MVSALALVFMACSLALCIAIPVLGIYLLARRDRSVLRAFAVGATAFFASQIILRIPLMSLATALAPDTVGAFVTSLPVASFSAGLFEETARLIFMVLLLKGFHRRADGIAFGLGHGGIEAFMLVGLTMLNNIIFAVLINLGQWDLVAGIMPSEAAKQIKTILVETPSTDYLAGGVERIWAIGLHISCSLIILMGVDRGKRFLAWLLAFLIHGCANLGAIGAMQHGVNVWVVECAGLAVIAVLLFLVLRWAGRVLPTQAKARPLVEAQ